MDDEQKMRAMAQAGKVAIKESMLAHQIFESFDAITQISELRSLIDTLISEIPPTELETIAERDREIQENGSMSIDNWTTWILECRRNGTQRSALLFDALKSYLDNKYPGSDMTPIRIQEQAHFMSQLLNAARTR